MLTFQLTIDQAQLSRSLPATRHLIARITPPPKRENREPAPLDLALAIDASGSMQGAPLAAVKAATLQLVRELPSSTRLTIVSFATDVVIHADAMPLDAGNREEIHRRVAELCTRGNTNLHGGWQTACTLLESEGNGGGGRRRRVVVLSDGRANAGIVDPESLGFQAASRLELGIATSCVGIGNGYSPDQLAALAEHGGGECHDAENATEIVDVLVGEVLSLAEVVAEDAQLHLEVPPGVRCRELSGQPATFDGRRLVVPMGSVRAGSDRVVVVRIELFDREPGAAAASAAGAWTVAEGHVEWREPGSPVRQSTPSNLVVLRDAAGPIDPPSSADAHAVLVAWQAYLVRRVTVLNRAHDFDALAGLWKDEFNAFVAYARMRADMADFVTTILRVRDRAMRPMEERSLKQAYDLATKGARQAAVHYKANKGGVAEQFHDFGNTPS